MANVTLREIINEHVERSGLAVDSSQEFLPVPPAMAQELGGMLLQAVGAFYVSVALPDAPNGSSVLFLPVRALTVRLDNLGAHWREEAGRLTSRICAAIRPLVGVRGNELIAGGVYSTNTAERSSALLLGRAAAAGAQLMQWFDQRPILLPSTPVVDETRTALVEQGVYDPAAKQVNQANVLQLGEEMQRIRDMGPQVLMVDFAGYEAMGFRAA